MLHPDTTDDTPAAMSLLLFAVPEPGFQEALSDNPRWKHRHCPISTPDSCVVLALQEKDDIMGTVLRKRCSHT